jgi:hypothetical protein
MIDFDVVAGDASMQYFAPQQRCPNHKKAVIHWVTNINYLKYMTFSVIFLLHCTLVAIFTSMNAGSLGAK